MNDTDLTWEQVCEWFDCPEYDRDALHTFELVFQALQHQTDEGWHEWLGAVQFLAAADSPGFVARYDADTQEVVDVRPAAPVYVAVQHTLQRIAYNLGSLHGVDPTDYSHVGDFYRDVRDLEHAYTQLGAELEAVKDTLARNEADQ